MDGKGEMMTLGKLSMGASDGLGGQNGRWSPLAGTTHGFTLAELLVVMAIMGAFVGMSQTVAGGMRTALQLERGRYFICNDLRLLSRKALRQNVAFRLTMPNTWGVTYAVERFDLTQAPWEYGAPLWDQSKPGFGQIRQLPNGIAICAETKELWIVPGGDLGERSIDLMAVASHRREEIVVGSIRGQMWIRVLRGG
jgi:prepilin-type N-terminal cleavage/methylation domain-containing protein